MPVKCGNTGESVNISQWLFGGVKETIFFQQVQRLPRRFQLQCTVHAAHFSRDLLQLGRQSTAVCNPLEKFPQGYERAADLLVQAKQEQDAEQANGDTCE